MKVNGQLDPLAILFPGKCLPLAIEYQAGWGAGVEALVTNVKGFLYRPVAQGGVEVWLCPFVSLGTRRGWVG
jgi:hypothetical protein